VRREMSISSLTALACLQRAERLTRPRRSLQTTVFSVMARASGRGGVSMVTSGAPATPGGGGRHKIGGIDETTTTDYWPYATTTSAEPCLGPRHDP
jgi:hypothetical protein